MSKNYWLKLNEQKQCIWTVSFIDNNKNYILRPRRVDIIDYSKSVESGKSSGIAKINFKDAMVSFVDKELTDFFIESRKSMKGWAVGIIGDFEKKNIVKYYELNDVKFQKSSIGATMKDIQFDFSYNDIKITNAF